MNVLVLAPDFYPFLGGAGTYVFELSRHLPKDLNIHILTPERVGQPKLEEIIDSLDYTFPDNITVHYAGKCRESFFFNLSFQLSCRKLITDFINRYRIDIVHSQSAMPDLFISPKKLGIPVVTTVHTTIEGQVDAIKQTRTNFNELYYSEKMTLLFSPVLKLLENNYYKGLRRYILVSEWSKHQFLSKKHVDTNKVTTIYHGVDSTYFSPDKKSRAEDHFPELADVDRPKVLFLSRIMASKGIKILQAAAQELVRRGDIHLIYGGPGKNPFRREQMENSTFLGYVDYRETPFVYALSDIFVLPSLYENFPLSVLEAAASGCAVIATRVGGIPEMITHGHNGFLIKPGSVESLREAINSFITDGSLRRRLADNGRILATREFTWDHTAQETMQYYQRLVN
jgi:glycosyltransferase involved in cell wall biosynthesis